MLKLTLGEKRMDKIVCAAHVGHFGNKTSEAKQEKTLFVILNRSLD